MLRLVYHEDRRNRNILLELRLWVKLWVADSYWLLQIAENISQKCLLDQTISLYWETVAAQSLGDIINNLLLWQSVWAISEGWVEARWRDNSVVEKDPHRLEGGSGFLSWLSYILALRPWPNHSISEPQRPELPSKDNLYPTELSCNQIRKNMWNT